MNPVAAIMHSLVLYRYSLVLSLAGGAAICFFMACCTHIQIPASRAAGAALTALILSLPLARLVYWYGRPDSFSSLSQVLCSPVTEAYALPGVLAGCALSALLTGGSGGRRKMLDCMSVAGCSGIALGRLGCFFTESDRGQIMVRFTDLPWAWPVTNAAGLPEYRLAVFLFQAAVTAVLGILLAGVFCRKKQKPGEITLIFLLIYCACQIPLDSTRYDSLPLRSNGFISVVQILSAGTLILVLVYLGIRTVKVRGFHGWMVPLWLSLAALLGGTGYMEYYVQRHGREAALSYSIMGACLTCIVILGLVLRRLSLPAQES